MENQVQRSAPEQPDEDEISLLDLFSTLLRHWRLIVFGSAGIAVIALGYAFGSLALPPEKSYLPNTYKPQSTMLIGSSSSGGLSSMLASSGLGSLAGLAGVGAGGNSSGSLAEALTKSNTTLDELDRRFDFVSRYKAKMNIKTNTRKAIQRALSGKFDGKTNLFTVSFEDTDPEFARDVVNATVEILERRFSALGGNRAITQKTLLETKLVDVKASMDDLELQTKRFQAKYGVFNVEALATEQITVLARLRSELIMKDLEITNYEKISTVRDPVRRRLDGEKDSILAKIRELESGKGQIAGERVMPSQRELPTIAFEYAKLQRDLLVQVEVYKLLTQQYEVSKLNAAGQEPVFQVLELAEAPDMKSGPARSSLVIVATMAGFFGMVLLAFVLEAIKNIRNDPEAMAKLKGAIRTRGAKP
ncbi:MAG: hypothetical protein WCL50_02085 [Spirochaetota bacterium]